MHAGRIYPFHPTYWATECWFFPDFCPWKLYWSVDSGSGGPWSEITIPQAKYSSPGFLTSDNKIISYTISVHCTSGYKVAKVSSELVYVEGRKCAQTKFTLYENNVPTYAAWNNYLVTTHPWNFGGFAIGKNLITGDDIPALLCTCRYARYDEVGSPWPNY